MMPGQGYGQGGNGWHQDGDHFGQGGQGYGQPQAPVPSQSASPQALTQ